MSKIITITFSPCIDKSTSIAELIPEKKLQCRMPTLEPGGGGINVARAIKKLGGSATAIFPSGGYTGKFFNHLLEMEHIPAVIIECANETRENIIVLDESTNKQYRFGMPGSNLSEEEWKQCVRAIEETDDIGFIVASGSLPSGVPLGVYAELAKIANDKQSKLVVDAPGEALQKAVEEGVYLIKPNMGELCRLAGRKELARDDIAGVAKNIISAGKCDIIVVSMGAAGAMLVKGDMVEMIGAPRVAMKSTVGAGDSMVAGIIYYLSEGKNVPEAVQYGVACGTAATMNPGTGLCKKEDADRLYRMIRKESTLQ